MQLAVDIGNSYSKAALYKEEQLLEFVYFNEQQPEVLSAIFQKYGNPSKGMIASVRNISPEFLAFLHSICPVKILDHTTPLPFKITYSTPQTLGRDRIAAVAAAGVVQCCKRHQGVSYQLRPHPVWQQPGQHPAVAAAVCAAICAAGQRY